MADSDSWVTTKEAAKLLHLSPDELRNRVEDGRIVGHKVGRFWRIERAELARILAHDPPRGFFTRQSAASVTLAGGRVWRSGTGDG